MTIDLNNLQLKFKFTDNDEMPATMTLLLGQYEVRGFSIRKSKFEENKEPFVVYPPANRSKKGGWIKIFWTDNIELWKSFSKAVLVKFNSEHTEYLLNQQFNEKDIINLKDIKL